MEGQQRIDGQGVETIGGGEGLSRIERVAAARQGAVKGDIACRDRQRGGVDKLHARLEVFEIMAWIRFGHVALRAFARADKRLILRFSWPRQFMRDQLHRLEA